MKVMIGHFSTESNGNIPQKNTLADYELHFGEGVIRKMQVKEVFDWAGIEIIPAIYAGAGPSGVITREAFDYIEACFVHTAREHLREIDGIYLFLHGAGEVEGLGSGDHHILHALRAVVGPYVPICVCCDPHGNLDEAYVRSLTAIRDFRESPHTDMRESYRRVAQMLCDISEAAFDSGWRTECIRRRTGAFHQPVYGRAGAGSQNPQLFLACWVYSS